MRMPFGSIFLIGIAIRISEASKSIASVLYSSFVAWRSPFLFIPFASMKP